MTGLTISKNTMAAAGLALLALVAGGSSVQAAAVASAAHAAHQARPAPPAGNDALYGVSCVRFTQCMAVGIRAAAATVNYRPLAESWDGTRWRVVPMPAPASLVRTQVSEVSCASDGSCVAVGYHYGAGGTDTADLAEEWNGTSWRIIQSGNPTGARSGFLSEVSCSFSGGCIAVGGYTGPSGGRALAELWAKGRWLVLPVPVPSGARASELNGISCGGRHCMAVGMYKDASGQILTLADRWTRSSWQLLHPADATEPISVLNGISCHASTRCMAVGFSYGSRQVPFTELWTGGRWHLVPGGLASGVLTGISCPGQASCIAVGTAAGEPVSEAWSGTRWRVLPAGRASGHQAGELNQLSCRTQSVRCIAVGAWYRPTTLTGRATLGQVWNGTSWAVMTTRNP